METSYHQIFAIEDSDTAIVKHVKQARAGARRKADKNKDLANIIIKTTIFVSAVTPIVIMLPIIEGGLKVIPAVLSGLVAAASTWMQIRKQDEKWIMYRTAQREIEFEFHQFRYGIGEYKGKSESEKQEALAEYITARELQIHTDWIPFAPRLEKLELLLNQQAARKQNQPVASIGSNVNLPANAPDAKRELT